MRHHLGPDTLVVSQQFRKNLGMPGAEQVMAIIGGLVTIAAGVVGIVATLVTLRRGPGGAHDGASQVVLTRDPNDLSALARPSSPGAAHRNTVTQSLTLSIVAIFFFWPLAIPALLNAIWVGRFYDVEMEYAGEMAYRRSLRWAVPAIIVGCTFWTAVSVIYVAVRISQS